MQAKIFRRKKLSGLDHVEGPLTKSVKMNDLTKSNKMNKIKTLTCSIMSEGCSKSRSLK